jgi:hypothetical protein
MLLFVELMVNISENMTLQLQGKMSKQWPAVDINTSRLQDRGEFFTLIGVCMADKEADQNYQVLFHGQLFSVVRPWDSETKMVYSFPAYV